MVWTFSARSGDFNFFFLLPSPRLPCLWGFSLSHPRAGRSDLFPLWRVAPPWAASALSPGISPPGQLLRAAAWGRAAHPDRPAEPGEIKKKNQQKQLYGRCWESASHQGVWVGKVQFLLYFLFNFSVSWARTVMMKVLFSNFPFYCQAEG